MNTRTLWVVAAAAALCLFLCGVPADADPAPASPPASPYVHPVRAWWTGSATAVADLERAADFGINTVIVENDVLVDWDKVIDGLALYDFSDRFRREGEGRARVEKLRARFGDITAAARRRGVDCYVMGPELHLPKGFGPPAYENPELWALLRDRLREVFRALPDLAGFTLYLCEGPIEVFRLPGREPSQAKRARKLVDTLWEACRAERRKLMVTTFIHRPETLEAIAEALRGFPPHADFSVLQYCCPNDWGLVEVSNPAIGRVGPHPEILGFDYAGENWGQGAHPYVQVEFMARRLGEARSRGANVVGLAGYVAWYHRRALGTFNEANVYAAEALARAPEREGGAILREWCAKRFGDGAADGAAAVLGRTREAVMKAQHVFGFWVDTGDKSGLPTLREMDQYFVGDHYSEALSKWDPKRRPVWDKIQAPDEVFVADARREKDEAAALCRRSLDEVRTARERFRAEDAAALERAFAFQELWARLWRDQMTAFFLRQIGRREGWTPERKARLEEALKIMEAEADELEKTFGKDVFPPGPTRAREFVRDVRGEVGK